MIGHEKKITQRIAAVARWLLKPVMAQPVFFAVVWLINCSVTLGYLAGCLFIEDNRPGHAMECVALGTAVSYLLTALVHLARPRWLGKTLKALVLTAMAVMEAVYVFIHLNFDMNLGPRLLILLAETNSHETSEFVGTYATAAPSLWTYAIVAAMILAMAVALWKEKALKKALGRSWLKRCLAVTLLPLTLWGMALCANYVKLWRCTSSKQLNSWVRDFGIDALDHVSSVHYSLCYLRVSDADIARAVESAQQVARATNVVTEPDSLNVVMVLGESYIKSHAALYGYHLNTTPHMLEEQRRGNLIAFTDIVTPYNATSQVQKNVFALNDLSQGEMWYEKPMFPTVFRNAGYKVFFWDNQRNYSTHELFTITVNSFIYNDTIASLSYDQTSNGSMTIDGNLIANFKKNATQPGKYNLYIFHLMGQHVHPVGRYPKKCGFDRFNADSIEATATYLTREKRNYVAQYDNATLYNDEVMKRIFDLWRDKNTVVLYLADHGDEAYDYRDHCGRGNVSVPNAPLLHCQNDVPMMVWCSNAFIARHPELVAQLRRAATRKGMSTDVTFMLLRLGAITTPYYRSERDISSPAYSPTPRIVYDKYDYDAVTHPRKTAK